MKDMKCVNLVQIDSKLVVLEIQDVENGGLAAPINNTLFVFLAPNTQLCVLIDKAKACTKRKFQK